MNVGEILENLGNSTGFAGFGGDGWKALIMIFIALKADGRGYSVTKMNNEIEMQKIEKALAEQAEREKAEQNKQAEQNEQDDKAEDEPSENSTVTEQAEGSGEGAKDESAERAHSENA